LKRFWKSNLLPWGILFLGLLFSLLMAWKSSLWIKETEEIRFQAASNHIINLIHKELDAHIRLIRSVAAFMNASESVSHEEWHQYALDNQINEQFLGFRALGYAPLVQPSECLKHEHYMHDKGFTHYAISQINPSSLTAVLFPVSYLEPLSDLNEKAFGLDLASESRRQEALYQSLTRANATVSSKINLVQKYITDHQAGFLIFFPLYQTREIPRSSDERLKEAKGVVYIAIDAKKMFEQLLASNYILADFEIYDGTAPKAENLLYSSNSEMKEPRLSHYVFLEIYGKTWIIHFKAKSILDMNRSHYYPWVQMFFSLLFFSALSGLIYVLQRTRKKAYEIAAEKTKQLATSEAEIRTIFETMQEGVIVMDQQGVVLECNLAAQQMLNIHKNLIISNANMTLPWNAVHEDGTFFPMDECPSFITLLTGKAQRNVVMGVKRTDGTLLWMSINAQPLFSDDRSQLTSVLVTFSDITEYRRSKYELEKYLQIIDTHVITSSTDVHGIILEVSEAFCKISGYSKEELIGKSHAIVRHPTIPKSFYKKMWQSLKKGNPWNGEILNKRKDGSDYWM
jgi:PAS domain S-box-containing protein